MWKGALTSLFFFKLSVSKVLLILIVFIDVNCEFCSKLLHLSDTFYNYADLCLSMIITVQVLCMQLLVQTSFDSVQLHNSRCDILSNYSACSVNVIYYMFTVRVLYVL